MNTLALARGALLCALVSLCGGVSIFILWLLTRWHRLEGLGFYWILIGTSLVVLGLSLLVTARTATEKISARRTRWTLALLLVNFPVAVAIIWLVTSIKYDPKQIEIRDASKPAVLTLSTWDRSPNSLSVQVGGSLDGVGRFRLGTEGPWVEVGPSHVDKLIRGGDWYEPEAVLYYEPKDVRNGRLVVIYQFH